MNSRLPRPARRLVAVGTALLLAAGASLVATESASAAVASLEGHVRTGSTGLFGIQVSLLNTSGTAVYTATTDGTGYFVFPSIASATYYIYYDGTSAGGNYVPEYMQDKYKFSSANPVIVGTGSYLGYDADLALGGSISGHVDKAVPSTGVFVTAQRLVQGTWSVVGSAGLDGSGNYVIHGLLPDSYRVKFQDRTNVLASEFYNNVVAFADAAAVTVTGTSNTPGINALLGTVPPVTVERIAGADRFATSAQIAAKFSVAAQGVVYVASGLNFPDALSAAPAASFRGGPLLLTAPDSVPQVVLDQIDRLNPTRIIVVGGASVVSNAVVATLNAYAPTDRISGPDRYATSRAIVADAFLASPVTTDGFVATGTGFADALSVSALAARRGTGVVLVYGPGASVDTETSDLLHDLGTADVYIAGGPPAVSVAMENSLGEIPSISTVTRLAGADRYATSVAVNQQFTTANYVYLATGTGFADALSGATLAGVNASPLYIVPPTCVPQAVLNEITRLNPLKVFLLGSEAALSASVQALTPC